MKLIGRIKKEKKETKEVKPIRIISKTIEKPKVEEEPKMETPKESGKSELPEIKETFVLSVNYVTGDGAVHSAQKLVTSDPLKAIQAVAITKEFGFGADEIKAINFTIEVVGEEVEK